MLSETQLYDTVGSPAAQSSPRGQSSELEQGWSERALAGAQTHCAGGVQSEWRTTSRQTRGETQSRDC